ncbi:unnamed protein product (macronuclear) [Paramecium tetraurelia]|uniref:Uncharacterized protein n=1 Tax=Paramecium tetraurelia TaxID=5888 RepID=A0BT62_PARTE|nr:uncharacterized protein GSPATT00031961001 [Paramecium tetraurelia]CAK61729.1 unnamed protein product [Paramecium tetraurelia]|eukprot:XP_001429127.1 hypothetical protein (macronuclear) [Paramecium tetraurelia strain d4-2]
MIIFYIFGFLYCINAALDYPTACDCKEHIDQDACEGHNCHWAQSECRVSECDERSLSNCTSASQFLSQNPYYCFIKNGRCEKLSKCEDIQISQSNVGQAREQCQLYQCAYDLVSGYCFKPEKCDDIYDQFTCDSFLIAKSSPLEIDSICYWDKKCKARSSFINNCKSIYDKDVCQQGGCQFENDQCKEIDCINRSIKECNGEYVDHQGKVFVCYENSDKCEKIETEKLHKEVCNSMIGHTYKDKQCKKCISYADHWK